MPIGVPMMMAARTTRMPIDSDRRAPNISRATWSRPRPSVPNGCSMPGALNFAVNSGLAPALVGIRRQIRREDSRQRDRDQEGHADDGGPVTQEEPGA